MAALNGPTPAVRAGTLLEAWVLPAFGIVTFLMLWAGCTAAGLAPARLLPGPGAAAAEFIDLTHTPYSGAVLQVHLLASLMKFSLGYGLAVLTGVPLGLMMGRYRIVEWAIAPLYESIRFIPPIAWVPFSILWLGTGFLAPTLVIFSGAFSPCVLNAYRGVHTADRAVLEAAQTLGAGRWATMTEVLLPAALPDIVAGLRVAAGFAWQSLIGAELIVGSTGLGYLIIQGESNLSSTVVVAGMITIGLTGAAIDFAMLRAERFVRRNWGQ
ncbi:MAG: ABC transporter permease [Acidocella sp.]|nr:ABC transporter permease [Acidocella sp.]